MKTNIIEYIIRHTTLKQKDIAEKLSVSPGQISKWKAGEYISLDKQQKLNELAGLFGEDTDWAILVKSPENGQAWCDYMTDLYQSMEGGVDNVDSDIPDSMETITLSILLDLAQLGVSIPSSPSEWPANDELSPLLSLLLEFLENLDALNEWCWRFLPDSDDEKIIDSTRELRSSAMELALRSVASEVREAAGITEFAFNAYWQKASARICSQLNDLCKRLNELGIPFTADYFDYLNKDAAYLEDAVCCDQMADDRLERFLPYTDRLLLQKSDHTHELLVELHVKLDYLLPEPAKIELREKLTHCKPA